ncbi:MAG: HigA family addiction module antidote protein [Planctomycetes bacterium]|nr:HigA family addiction module antidote protein [Planctomycetota bacterium]
MEIFNVEKNFFIKVHPGKVLQNILDEGGISQAELARHLHIPQSKINEICRSKRGISAEMAVKLGKVFKQSPEFWLNLQKNWELSQVSRFASKGIKQLVLR